MPFRPAHGNGCFEQGLIAVLVTALCLAAVAFVTLPRPGAPVALVPLNAKAARELPRLVEAPRTLLLARGAVDGSFIIQGETPGFLEALSKHGVLTLNATAPGCGPSKVRAIP